MSIYTRLVAWKRWGGGGGGGVGNFVVAFPRGTCMGQYHFNERGTISASGLCLGVWWGTISEGDRICSDTGTSLNPGGGGGSSQMGGKKLKIVHSLL